jgi:RHS repeat-associated protein
MTAFTHDALNRLLTATKPGMAAAYEYDADDRRSAKAVTQGTSVVTRTLWSGTDELAEYDGAGALLRRVIPGPGIDDKVASIEASGAVRYFHTDRLGSVVAVSDAGGTATDAYAYSPYGESEAAPTGNPWRYTGRYLDAETGLYYYRARYYSARLGQFLETDPIGTKDDSNLYMYVGLDPANLIDPTGLRPPERCDYDCMRERIEAARRLQREIERRERQERAKGIRIPVLGRTTAFMMALTLCGDSQQSYGQDYYVLTYTKRGPNNEIYSGRTSGFGRTPIEVLRRRDASHKRLRGMGFEAAELDVFVAVRSDEDRDAIKGREQALISVNGGAQSRGGTSANRDDAIDRNDPRRSYFLRLSEAYFGAPEPK